MAMSAGGGGHGFQNDINVTPMIDVLLVLLVIFMIAVPMLRKAVDLQLPDPNPPQTVSTPNPDQIVLQIAADGSLKINSMVVPKGNLADSIHKVFDARPTKVIFVKADGNVTYQTVIHAIDVAKGAGVLVFGIPPEEKGTAAAGAAAAPSQ
ncbi:MAG TPA: biopolymer transporter ExbD [Gemmatimonadaceae bacterium]|nr:biopolymer transporter ExbD [Gemmatimonadaceae bacterium]